MDDIVIESSTYNERFPITKENIRLLCFLFVIGIAVNAILMPFYWDLRYVTWRPSRTVLAVNAILCLILVPIWKKFSGKPQKKLPFKMTLDFRNRLVVMDNGYISEGFIGETFKEKFVCRFVDILDFEFIIGQIDQLTVFTKFGRFHLDSTLTNFDKFYHALEMVTHARVSVPWFKKFWGPLVAMVLFIAAIIWVGLKVVGVL